MKKKIAMALTLVLVIIGGFVIQGINNQTKAASVDINVSAPTVKKGQEFSVNLQFSSDIALQSVEGMITYNEEVLEFVGCDDQAVAGASGVITVKDDFMEGKEVANYELKFIALELGESDISVTDVLIEEIETQNFISPITEPVKVTVTTDQAQENDARLKELLIGIGELEGEFNPDVYEYTVNVPNEVEQLVLSAIPMDDNGVVEVDTEKTLEVGNNVMEIKVIATSGDTKTYVLNINRLAEKSEEEVPVIEAKIAMPGDVEEIFIEENTETEASNEVETDSVETEVQETE